MLAAICAPAVAQRHEIGLTLGRLVDQTRSAASGRLELGTGTALQANYGYRLAGGAGAALFGEVHFLANPQRVISTSLGAATRDIASLYVTPGIRLKLLPAWKVSPWVAFGGGYAQYEHSTTRVDGRPNEAPRRTHRGALSFGGGVDVKVLPFLSLRGEVRDFYSGSPDFNVAKPGGGQHNVVLGGGFVLRF